MSTGTRSRGARSGGGSGGRVRWAVIGQGYFAQSAVLPAFANAGRRSELTAIFSADPSKLKGLKRRHGVEFALGYDEYDSFLAGGNVDAVYIALPNSMHRDYTIRAAQAGVHVLCEKPMAATAADCEQMIAVCDENDVKLMVAYRLHFEKANMEAVDIVKSGRIGDARAFNSVFAFQVEPPNIRLEREMGGGPLLDIGTYCINAARYIFQSEPIDVMAYMGTSGDERFHEVEEAVSAVVRFPGERMATFTVSFNAAGVASYEVIGTRGVLRVDPAYHAQKPLAYTLTIDGRTRERKLPHRDQVAPELIHFADCILEDREPEPSGLEGLADLRVIEAIRRAAATGSRVAVAPVDKERRPAGDQAVEKPGPERPELINARPPH